MRQQSQPHVQTQQELLRRAMDELRMTRSEFAERLSVSVRTLDKWLLPDDSVDARTMPEMGKAYVREILEWHRKEA
jgi:transcriptional regulator with XRE-family HTH domain